MPRPRIRSLLAFLVALLGLITWVSPATAWAHPASAPPTYTYDSLASVVHGALIDHAALGLAPRSATRGSVPSHGLHGLTDGFVVAADTAAAGESDPLITVRHFTDDVGRSQILQKGSLRSGTYVTLPEEIPSGTSPEGVEKLLEIESGKGSNFIDVLTRSSNLGLPENGPLTSGGAWQRVLQNPVDLGGAGFWPR